MFSIGHAWTTDYGCSEKEEEFHWLIKYGSFCFSQHQKYTRISVLSHYITHYMVITALIAGPLGISLCHIILLKFRKLQFSELSEVSVQVC